MRWTPLVEMANKIAKNEVPNQHSTRGIHMQKSNTIAIDLAKSVFQVCSMN